MTRPLVCIVAEGDWPALGRTLDSVRSRGLRAVVGVTGQRERGAASPDVRIERITWRDDFADARNQLASRVDEPWLLWLDSDERLTRFEAPDLDGVGADAFAVRIRDRADLTPRPIARLQRNAPGILWRRAVHETIVTHQPGDPPILDGIEIEHDGYASAQAIAVKIRRNQAIAVAARARGDESWVYALEDARFAEATGGDAFKAWLAAFNHPDAAPAGPGGVDGRVEAAEALAAMGYPTPARVLLAANPRIVALHLALLLDEARQGRSGPGRVDDLVGLLRGGADDRYAMPVALLGADRAVLERWIADRVPEHREAAGR